MTQSILDESEGSNFQTAPFKLDVGTDTDPDLDVNYKTDPWHQNDSLQGSRKARIAKLILTGDKNLIAIERMLGDAGVHHPYVVIERKGPGTVDYRATGESFSWMSSQAKQLEEKIKKYFKGLKAKFVHIDVNNEANDRDLGNMNATISVSW